MNLRLGVIIFVAFSSLPSSAQERAADGTAAQPSPKQQATPAASPIDTAKEADIRRLLDLVGTTALATKSVETMTTSIRPLLTSSLPPGDYRDTLVDLFFAKLTAKMDMKHLLDLAVPIYDKNFTHEEILGLIQFYQTPLGRKAVSVLPQVTAELQQAGRKWGQELGAQAMKEVLAEHPDLAQALKDARK